MPFSAQENVLLTGQLNTLESHGVCSVYRIARHRLDELGRILPGEPRPRSLSVRTRVWRSKSWERGQEGRALSPETRETPAGRPQEAQQEFARALALAPKRALSLLGLGRAAAAAGDRATATRAYSELREIWHGADPSLPGLADATRFLAANP